MEDDIKELVLLLARIEVEKRRDNFIKWYLVRYRESSDRFTNCSLDEYLELAQKLQSEEGVNLSIDIKLLELIKKIEIGQ